MLAHVFPTIEVHGTIVGSRSIYRHKPRKMIDGPPLLDGCSLLIAVGLQLLGKGENALN